MACDSAPVDVVEEDDEFQNISGVQETSVTELTNPEAQESSTYPPTNSSSPDKNAVPRGGRYIIVDLMDTIDMGLLPEGWVRIRHVSGLLIYLHRSSRVVTLSRPYSVGPGSIRFHRIPVTAIPCLAYRKARGEKISGCPVNTHAETESAGVGDEMPSDNAVLSSVPDDPNLMDAEKCPRLDSERQSVNECDEEMDVCSSSLNSPDHLQRTLACPALSEGKRDLEEGELSSVDDDDIPTIAVPIGPTAKQRRLETPPKPSEPAVIDRVPSSTDSGSIANTSVVSFKTNALFGRRRRRKRTQAASVLGVTNDGQMEKQQVDETSKVAGSDLSEVKAQVLAVKNKEVQWLLTTEEIRAYCRRLFEIKVVSSSFHRGSEKRGPGTEEKATDGSEKLLPLPEETKMIRYQLPASENERGRKQLKEGLINMTGKTFVCILHEYCQNVIRRPPTYETVVLENDRNPYQLTVMIDGKPYATGVGQSKKQARSEAARKALERLIPDFSKIVGQNAQPAVSSSNSEQDVHLFDSVQLTDPRLYEMSVHMALPTPYNLLVECLSRSCVPENDLKSTMTSQGRNRHFFTLELREHSIKIPCKNKREGRHLAAQHLLARLHPEVTTWGELLRMYGPGSKPDKRGDLETIQGSQSQEKSAVKSSLIRLLKSKMSELADQWEKGGGSIQPKGKFFVPPDNLPVVTFHPDSATEVYTSVPDQESPSVSPPSSPRPLNG
ncbi:unnamed protein product [Calicophoron daubneyi]|uniref:DRBM domain-containing protein n=1 Tax=Calicophoron daubneyi TaxID=300641 RepID=A0AAV2TPA5_CALDB